MKRKTHLTRKNLIFLSLVFFFLLLQIFVLLCLNTNSGFIKKTNPIASFAKLMGMATLSLTVTDYVSFFLVIFWTFMAIASILYEIRLARYYDDKVPSKKYGIYHLLTVVVCIVLSFGVSIILQLPYSMDKFSFTISILWETFLLALLFYLLIGGIITAVCVLIINFKNIDKPFRFFGKKETLLEEEETQNEINKAKTICEESDLSHSLDIKESVKTSSANTVVSGNGIGGRSIIQENGELKDKQKVFPGLCAIDSEYEFYAPEIISDDISLENLCVRFRNYLANNHLYFELRTIREFISSFSTSRLIILEGLSGTGKSSLPRYFASFLKSNAFFAPVQATWRDRTSLLGYYNDFSRSFNETDFLKRLYKASYKPSEVNIMVLDELNLSRIEYYFADFLSVLEYPSEDWKLTLMQLPYSFEAPKHVEDGKIQIPNNTFFVGTANKDDSTYTITDKVYDRAITIDFDDRNEPFEVEGDASEVSLSYQDLNNKFVEAQQNKKYQLTKFELEEFKKITDFTYDTFDITFGNRILNQIELFVPVYLATGGTKEEALDFLFERKVLYKLEGRFEDYVKTGLLELKDLIINSYGNKFDKSLREIDRMLKRL